MSTLLLTHPLMRRHDTGRGNPESIARLEAVLAALEGPFLRARHGQSPTGAAGGARTCAHRTTRRRHAGVARKEAGRIEHDTDYCPDTIDAALAAAGAGVDAIEAIGSGAARNAFVIARPPGHHAEAQHAMGFCFFNTIAVAAAHAIATGVAERVLIVDFDVHHGNGTERAFYERGDVLFFSVHQSPLYPGTGAMQDTGTGAARGTTVNVPLAAGASNTAYIGIHQHVLVPIADRFCPDLVLVSAGYDAHEADPLGGMDVTDEGYAALMAIIRDIAKRHANDRLALVLEGGYGRAGACAVRAAGGRGGCAVKVRRHRSRARRESGWRQCGSCTVSRRRRDSR